MIDLNDIARRIKSTPTLVLDTETDGLEWRVNQAVGYVLTFSPNPVDSFYLPIRHKGGGNLPDPARVVDMLRYEISARGAAMRVVGHSLDFDMGMCANDGIYFSRNLEDTQIDAFLVNEHHASFSLDALCRYYDVQTKKGQVLYDHIVAKFPDLKLKPTPDSTMGHFHELAGDDPVAVDYATGDGTSTWQLWEKLQTKLDEPDVRGDTLRRIWKIECRCISVLFRMTRRGTRVDEERLAEVEGLVAARLSILQAKLPPGFKDNAPTHVRKYFEDNGGDLSTVPRTPPSRKFPEGQLSFNATFLEHHPIGKPIVACRKLTHLQNSFIKPLKERHLWNGRVHPHYNQTRGEEYGTITGRLSCDSPNMQQVPKRNKELGAIFRAIFVPDPGMTWASADYGQCEPRLLAHYGEVKVLLDGYLQTPPVDAHQAVANAAGIDREPGKRMNQALLTGAGMKRMKELLYEYGATPSEAERIMGAYFASMPEIKSFQKGAAAIYKQRGYILTLLGRRLHLNDARFDYQAVNRILQGGNADINKRALADVDEYYESQGDVCHLLNDVHDDLCHQYPKGERHQLEHAVKLMEDYGPDGQTVPLLVPMVVDVGEGVNWSEASYGVDTVKKMFKQMGGEYRA